MKNYVYKLFLKTELLNDDILSPSLYISFDKASALRADYKLVLNLIKQYDKIEIIKSNERGLNEGYEQGLYIIKVDNKEYFLRLILSDKKIYDVLVYTIIDKELINRIFFSQEVIEINSDFLSVLAFDNPSLVVIKESDNYRIIKANKEFYDLIKYEDWDFANKYQNVLNQIAVDQKIDDIEEVKLYQSDKSIITLSFKSTIRDNLILLEYKK